MGTSLYAVVDPSTGSLVKEYPTATDEQIEEAVTSAARAHREWSRGSTPAELATLIRKVAELHTERRDELADDVHLPAVLDRGLADDRGFAEAVRLPVQTPPHEPGQDPPHHLLAVERPRFVP